MRLCLGVNAESFWWRQSRGEGVIRIKNVPLVGRDDGMHFIDLISWNFELGMTSLSS